jgi:hypothetical protein
MKFPEATLIALGELGQEMQEGAGLALAPFCPGGKPSRRN